MGENIIKTQKAIGYYEDWKLALLGAKQLITNNYHDGEIILFFDEKGRKRSVNIDFIFNQINYMLKRSIE